jgi:hypothetical protein
VIESLRIRVGLKLKDDESDMDDHFCDVPDVSGSGCGGAREVQVNDSN